MHTHVYKNVHLHGWTLNPVKVQMFGSRVPGSPRVPDQRPWLSHGGGVGTLDRKASWEKCHGGMCIFVPDRCHHSFPPILGQKLAFLPPGSGSCCEQRKHSSQGWEAQAMEVMWQCTSGTTHPGNWHPTPPPKHVPLKA